MRRRWDIRGVAFDGLAVVAAAALVGLGTLNLYVVSGRSDAVRQVALGAVGILLLIILRATRLGASAVVGWSCYIVSVVLLAGVAVVGVSANGARRWLAVGSFTFQPSELGEIGLLLIMAHLLGSHTGQLSLRRFLAAVALALVPIGLTVLEPDLSTALLLTLLAVAMLVLARVPLRFMLPLIGSAVIAAPLAISLLRPYQLSRIHGFTHGAQNAAGSAYATLESHIALASAGLLGQHRSSTHTLLAQYLPDRTSDLALASLVEQWGLAAGAAALLAAAVLVWRLALAARLPRDRASGLLAAGLAVLLGLEAVVSVGGNLGKLPLAGVPFPLLSTGGTVLIVHLAAIGLALGARRDGVKRWLWSAPHWDTPKPRWVRAGALSMSCLLGVFGFLGWQLQAHSGPSLRLTAQNQMTRCVNVPATRGVITDRHGVVIAGNVAENDVQAIPSVLLKDPAGLIHVAVLVGQPVATLEAKLHAARRDLALKLTSVPPLTAAAVAALHVPGVMIAQTPGRIYPAGALLGPILGYVGVETPADERRWPNLPRGEMVGRAGIEEEYDPLLRGVDGQECVYVNPAGQPAAVSSSTPPVPGVNVALSIDLGFQQQLTTELASALAAGGRDIGGVVAMDPRTGQVLAMASLPTYDNSLYGPPVNSKGLAATAARQGEPMLEHDTQAAAPPGSTFKLVIAAADTVYNVIPPQEVIPTGASFTVAGHTFNNWSNLAPMNLANSIAWSNDVYFYKLAWALGANRINWIGASLGVGQPTGLDLPGESGGYFGSPASVMKSGRPWYTGSTVLLGIGQGYLTVTPLQDARWTAAVTTGALVTPRLGMAAGTGTGALAPLPAPPATPLSFASQLGPVQVGMIDAVKLGLASQLTNLPVVAGAKTGTAEDASSPNGKSDSWFTAAAPLPNPSIVMTSLVRGGGEGAATSGPIVDQGLQYYFAHEAQILSTIPGA